MIWIIRMLQRGRCGKTTRYPSNLLWLVEVVPVYFLLLSKIMRGKQFLLLVSPPPQMQVLGAFGLQPACSGWQGRVQAGDGSLGVLRTKHPLRHPCHDTRSNVHTHTTNHPLCHPCWSLASLLWYVHKPQCVDCVVLLCFYRGSYKGIQNALYGACFFSHFDSLFYFYLTLNSKKTHCLVQHQPSKEIWVLWKSNMTGLFRFQCRSQEVSCRAICQFVRFAQHDYFVPTTFLCCWMFVFNVLCFQIYTYPRNIARG